MKRIYLGACLVAATVLSACGDKAQDVSQANALPLIFNEHGSVHNGATSTRRSVDLLSLN